MNCLIKKFGKSLYGLTLILLVGGCADIINAPPAAPDMEGGEVLITIGSGMERTVFPRMNQFSKIVLSFERKDAMGSREDEEVSLGETLINLTPGTWEVTAAAYNSADPPAPVARAVNTLTRTGDAITGDSYFALEPAGSGPGVLRYSVALPGGIALDAAQSRIRIEQDGAILSSLNNDNFTAGSRTISGAISGTLSLGQGRYAVDIVLDDNGSANTAVFRAAAAILPGLVTEIAFAPAAGDFLDPDVRLALTAAATFGRTQTNTSGTVVGAAGGEGANRTRILSVPKGTGTMYFTLTKTGAQTIALDIAPDSAAAGKVSWTESGTVDGSVAGGNRAVFTVNTGDLAEAGGDRVFVLRLEEAGKAPLAYTVTVAVPYLTKIVIDKFPSKRLYMKGAPLDLTGMEVTGTWSDLKTFAIPTNEFDINGFDTTQTGDQRLSVVKNGVSSNNSFTVVVIESAGRLFFDHGLTSGYASSPYQYYTVPQGRTVVLAPVKWLIPEDAVYEWQLDDVPVTAGVDGEYFSYTGTASSGEHTVMVIAKQADGSEIARASTKVVCVGGAVKRETTEQSNVQAEKLYSVVAPGQFGSTSSRLGTLHGFGGFGGYAVFKFDHSIEKKSNNGEEIQIGGNAFGGWNEPGAIWVSQDENGNGLSDDTWYELKGSHTLLEQETIRRYAVTFRSDYYWVDNLGNSGTYPTIQAWPAGTPIGMTELTLVGTRLDPSTQIIRNGIWGYADVLDNGRVSLSNAIQADGTSVDLPFVDFVKIVTAVHDADSTLGERSCEANTPTDRFMRDPNKLIAGKDLGGGSYEYRFTNNSGYPLTVEFDGTSFNLSDGGTVVKTSTNPSEYIDFYGGNAYLSKSEGQVTFTAGPDA
jgi:hypothetical protein